MASLVDGQSGAAVFRVTVGLRTLVVKRARPSEWAFYDTAAPLLRHAGVGIPDRLWSLDLGDASWLVLEYIPRPLPRERWLADPATMVFLRRLHGAQLPSLDLPGGFRPAWSGSMTTAALDTLPAERSERLRPIMRRFQEEAGPLFEPRHPISGDPNPTNWGLRDDGTAVLFDWERFSHGTAALDLAITIPWLSESGAYRQVAAAYLAAAPDGAEARQVAALARQVAVAKVWNVVEYLSLVTLGGLRQSPRVEAVIQAASDWLTSVARP